MDNDKFWQKTFKFPLSTFLNLQWVSLLKNCPKSSHLSGVFVEHLQFFRRLQNARGYFLMAIFEFPNLTLRTDSFYRPDPIYFYNVTLSDCQSSTKGFCGRSRNRFSTKEACMKTCVLDTETSIINEVEKRPSSQPASRKFTRRFGSNWVVMGSSSFLQKGCFRILRKMFHILWSVLWF